MKITIQVLLIIFLWSCESVSEKKLYGKWYDIKGTNYLEFKKDTLILNAKSIHISNFTEKVKWKANENEINIKYINPCTGETEKLIYEYKIIKDSLIYKFNKEKFNYIKAKNYIDFITKKFNFKLKLPKSNAYFKKNENHQYSIEIFIGIRNGETIFTTEFKNNLDQLNDETTEIINSLPESEARLLHYRVFADENISQIVSNRLYTKLLNTKIKRIYKMYETDGNSKWNAEIIKKE